MAPTESEPGKIVVRYADGTVLKGHASDFFPNKPLFHLFPIDEPQDKAIAVQIKDLRAIFFVRDFARDPLYSEGKEFAEGARPPGRKMEVTFRDGEVLVGSTLGYDPQRPGFFIIPADPKSNTLRVFVVSAAVTNVRFL